MLGAELLARGELMIVQGLYIIIAYTKICTECEQGEVKVLQNIFRYGGVFRLLRVDCEHTDSK